MSNKRKGMPERGVMRIADIVGQVDTARRLPGNKGFAVRDVTRGRRTAILSSEMGSIDKTLPAADGGRYALFDAKLTP